jgi:hypothetical protein
MLVIERRFGWTRGFLECVAIGVWLLSICHFYPFFSFEEVRQGINAAPPNFFLRNCHPIRTEKPVERPHWSGEIQSPSMKMLRRNNYSPFSVLLGKASFKSLLVDQVSGTSSGAELQASLQFPLHPTSRKQWGPLPAVSFRQQLSMPMVTSPRE